jgi:hypothetical protein
MVLFARGLSRAGIDRQGVNVATHQFGGGSIDHPMSLHLRDPVEGGCRDGDVEVSAFARAGMADVPGAVVTNLEQGRMQGGLQRGPQPFHPFAHVGSFSWKPRISQNVVKAVKMKMAGRKNQVLSATQVASGNR